MNQLRRALDERKQTLVNALINLGAIHPSDQSIYGLTLSELDYLLKQSQERQNQTT